ncbi:MAG: sigma-54-dependent transcriptional regulator, partial [Thermodesulfobacteriota bacterium]
MANILIIDDDKLICRTLSHVMTDRGHTPTCAFGVKEGLEIAAARPFDVVFLDVRLPDGNGLDMVPRLKEFPSSPEVIIITGFGDMDGAELAITYGAWDYLEKSASIDEITLPLERALQYRTERQAKARPTALNLEGIVGSSAPMRTCIELLAQAAATDANVLITGETGTGKELFSSAIHRNSPRAGKNFVVVDCAALPETIVESILFGHERGAFTGAEKSKTGLITQADGGTLFLDEVGELPASVQGSFLRALQERRFRPVGSIKEVKSDFRLIAASNRNLDQMVQEGLFRRDLLFRLRTLTINLPPLREHLQDINELTPFYMSKLSHRSGKGMKGFSHDFMNTLLSYTWPGNVRELVNALERAMAAAGTSPTLFPAYLPLEIRITVKRGQVGEEQEAEVLHPVPSGSDKVLPTLQEHREAEIARIEQHYLEELMAYTSGD